MTAPEQPIHHLILVRHSQPEITPGVAARDWRLSEEGRRRCMPLAAEIAHRYAPVVVVSSDEPKAIETAEFITQPLDCAVEIVPGLHEHERDTPRVLDDAAFQAAIAAFFARPGELVFGQETADAALARFTRAITGALAAHPVGDIVVVTHGTVMSLYVAVLAGLDPYPLWMSLRLPDLRVITRPEVS